MSARTTTLLLLLLAGLILVERLHTRREPINRDLGDYAAVAHEMHCGKALYSDLPDQKPPGIHVTYYIAEAIAGYEPGAIALMGVTAAWITLIAAWATVMFLTGSSSAALWAGTFWAVICGDLLLEANQPNAEVFMNAFTMTGLAFMASQFRRRQDWTFIIAAGICFALATLYKQVIVTVPICVGLAWVMAPTLGRSRLRAFTEVLVLGGIIAAAWGATVGYFAYTGRFDAFWHWVITYNRRYAGNLDVNLLDLFPNLFPGCLLAMLPLGLLAAGGIVIGVFRRRTQPLPPLASSESLNRDSTSTTQEPSAPTARPQSSLGQRPRTSGREASRAESPTQSPDQELERAFSPDEPPREDLGRCPRLVWGRAFGPEIPPQPPQPRLSIPSFLSLRLFETHQLQLAFLLILLAIGTVLAVALPGRFSPHYYQLWFPWLVAGGGCALAELEQAWSRRVAAWVGTVTLAALAAFQAPNYLLSPDEWSNLKYSRLFIETNHIGRQIKTLLAPGETFFALADEAELYPVSGLRPPTRFLGIAGFTDPVESGALRTLAVNELCSAKPDLILTDLISLLLLQKVHDLQILPYITANYRPVAREYIRFTFMVRKGSALDQRFGAGTAKLTLPLGEQ